MEDSRRIAEAARHFLSTGDADAILRASVGDFDSGVFEASLNAAAYEKLAAAAIRQGENFLGYDFALAGIQRAAEVSLSDFRLRQLEALALARGGAPHRAEELLKALEREGAGDAHTVGLLARTYRDFALTATDAGLRNDYFRMAFKKAYEGYRANRSYYNGIQAAQFALLSGESEPAVRLSGEVERLCQIAIDQSEGDKEDAFWLEETLAECFLIRGQIVEAKEAYRRALSLGSGRPADVGATLKVCRLLLEKIGEPADLFDGEFAAFIPPVIVFSGHMLDRPGRKEPRFTPPMAGPAAVRIDERLAELKPREGYCAGACGGDLIFAESLIRIGLDVNLVLPFDLEKTRGISVKTGGEIWLQRYDRVVKKAKTIKELKLSATSRSPIDFRYSNHVMCGLAMLKARPVEARILPMVLWDGKPGEAAGGTADFVKFWRARGVEPEIVSTEGLLEEN